MTRYEKMQERYEFLVEKSKTDPDFIRSGVVTGQHSINTDQFIIDPFEVWLDKYEAKQEANDRLNQKPWMKAVIYAVRTPVCAKQWADYWLAYKFNAHGRDPLWNPEPEHLNDIFEPYVRVERPVANDQVGCI